VARKKNAVADLPVAEARSQRTKIVQATFSVIAEKGFEGLRMREIAARAGLNHSTLHYYFAGKEALISGLMDYMVQELSLGREKVESEARLTPREELASHFAALLRQAREQPEIFDVLAEIQARSARDAGIRAVMSANERTWKKFIIEILERGKVCGDFDSRLNPEIAAEATLAMVRGLNLRSSTSLARAESALRQLAKWLTGCK
jgi:AcrR family transcriptional regulator